MEGDRVNRADYPREVLDSVSPSRLREYRKSLKESQCCFWSRFGVTQSRGSRFEMGAEIPSPVAILLELYIKGIITDRDLRNIPGADDCLRKAGALS